MIIYEVDIKIHFCHSVKYLRIGGWMLRLAFARSQWRFVAVTRGRCVDFFARAGPQPVFARMTFVKIAILSSAHCMRADARYALDIGNTGEWHSKRGRSAFVYLGVSVPQPSGVHKFG